MSELLITENILTATLDEYGAAHVRYHKALLSALSAAVLLDGHREKLKAAAEQCSKDQNQLQWWPPAEEYSRAVAALDLARAEACSAYDAIPGDKAHLRSPDVFPFN